MTGWKLREGDTNEQSGAKGWEHSTGCAIFDEQSVEACTCKACGAPALNDESGNDCGRDVCANELVQRENEELGR